jgi:RNA polymerase sigma factor (sigma-70 family)
VRRSDDPATDRTLADLVSSARAGDAAAWEQLCGRVRGVAWKVINGYSLPSADADDAFAATMFRLAENLDRLREPDRLPGWVATTARNEVLSIFRSRRRLVVTDEPPATSAVPGDHDHDIVLDELRAAVRAAFSRLSDSCQKLLRVLTADPPMPYSQVEELFAMPHGSIGPRRGRCLDELRAMPELREFLQGGWR